MSRFSNETTILHTFRLDGRHDGWFYHGDGVTYPGGAYGLIQNTPLITDLNGDGRQDFVFAPAIFPHVAARPGAEPIILLSGGQSILSHVDVSGERQGLYRFDAGDFNGDGRLDIVGATTAAWPGVPGERYVLLMDDGAGNFTEQSNNLPEHEGGIDPKNWARDVAVGDVDLDGDMDLIFAGMIDSGGYSSSIAAMARSATRPLPCRVTFWSHSLRIIFRRLSRSLI